MSGSDEKKASGRALRERKILQTECAGIVKWFNCRRGYGFIERQSPGPVEDIFVHRTAIPFSKANKSHVSRTLDEGEAVTFELREGREGQKEAWTVTGPEGAILKGSRFARTKAQLAEMMIKKAERMAARANTVAAAAAAKETAGKEAKPAPPAKPAEEKTEEGKGDAEASKAKPQRSRRRQGAKAKGAGDAKEKSEGEAEGGESAGGHQAEPEGDGAAKAKKEKKRRQRRRKANSEHSEKGGRRRAASSSTQDEETGTNADAEAKTIGEEKGVAGRVKEMIARVHKIGISGDGGKAEQTGP